MTCNTSSDNPFIAKDKVCCFGGSFTMSAHGWIVYCCSVGSRGWVNGICAISSCGLCTLFGSCVTCFFLIQHCGEIGVVLGIWFGIPRWSGYVTRNGIFFFDVYYMISLCNVSCIFVYVVSCCVTCLRIYEVYGHCSIHF